MEQQSQEKARQTEQTRQTEDRTSRTPERERISSAGYVMRAALEGASLLDMPPARLEELAGWIGNQNMAALLEAQAGPVALTRFVPPGPEPETAPIPVPEITPQLTRPPQTLTAGGVTGRALQPSRLAFPGGGYHGSGL